MKKILYLTFYFEPDLCAGSFRNTPLLKELAKQTLNTCEIDVITTLPNRYSSFQTKAKHVEKIDNYIINRVQIPLHKSGMRDQILSFRKYYLEAQKIAKRGQYDLVFASSSRLFTAYLGYKISKKQNIPLYIDVRDIFIETISDVVQNKIFEKLITPILKNIEKKVFSYAKHINLISGGFKDYFQTYQQANFTEFSNGIDDVFIENKNIQQQVREKRIITYAGNIGDSQGLHKIIPGAAKRLGNDFEFHIIGDGGAKPLLEEELKKYDVQNVIIKKPIKREELIEIYNQSDFLFIHLNAYNAFLRVLPSKIFELGTFNKPIIAGVKGYSSQFIKDNIDNHILFDPCDVDSFVEKLIKYKYRFKEREIFKKRYQRSNINHEMAKSITQYLSN